MTHLDKGISTEDIIRASQQRMKDRDWEDFEIKARRRKLHDTLVWMLIAGLTAFGFIELILWRFGL